MSLPGAAALAALVLAAALPGGPLAFVPPVLRWPLVAGAALPLLRGARSEDGRRAASAVELPLVVLALATFLLLKVPGIRAAPSDDAVYAYLATRVAEGEVPYRDFFFAHPPLHLLVPAAVFRLAGWSIGVAKAIPVVLQATAALLLWLAARRASRAYALLVLVLHLTTYAVLTGASDMNGGNLASLLLAAALLAAVRRSPALAGARAGLSTGTVVYALASAAGPALVAGIRGGRRAALRFVAGAAAAVGAVFGASFAVGRDEFLHGVFRFHAARPAEAGRARVLGAAPADAIAAWLANLRDAGADLPRNLYFHAPVAAALVAAAALLAARGLRRRPAPLPGTVVSPLAERAAPALPAAALAAAGLATAALALLQSAALAEVHAFYALPAMPFVSLAAGYGLFAAAGRLAARPRDPAALAAIAVLALHPLAARVALPRAFPAEAAAAGEVARYPWPGPEVPAPLARASRALLWRGERIRGEPEPPWRHALWAKSSVLARAREVAAHVRDGTAPGDTITGASTVAPLVALLAGRRLAAGEADTNAKRFRAGSLDEAAFLERILADRVRFVVAHERSFFDEGRLSGDPRWSAAFALDRAFTEEARGAGAPLRIALYRRRER